MDSQEILIAVMGPTGSGKSHFIDTLSQSTQWSGTTLQSVTAEVRSTQATIMHNGEKVKVALVDTPGFDDTNKPDSEILQMIATWLADKYKRHICLSGILYLHRITDNRMAGTPHRNLRMFGKLCGNDEHVARKVSLVTSMWDKLPHAHPTMGEDREQQLLEKFWAPMTKLGAHCARFENNRASAEQIIADVLDQDDASQPILLQEEMVDLHMHLNETEAAKTLYSQYQVLLAQHKATLADLESAATGCQDTTMLADLQNERQRIEDELNKTFGQVKQLKIDPGRRFMRLFQKKSKSTPVFD